MGLEALTPLDVMHKNGSTSRIATLPEQDRAKAINIMHSDWTSRLTLMEICCRDDTGASQ